MPKNDRSCFKKITTKAEPNQPQKVRANNSKKNAVDNSTTLSNEIAHFEEKSKCAMTTIRLRPNA